MHAIIMGAGEGTRMWPLSSLVNKHLLKLGGKPVIRIIVEKLLTSRNFDNEDITIVCLKKDTKDYKWEFRDFEVNLHIIEENKGTANEFYAAMIKTHKEDVLLHYGDTITDLDYGQFIEFFQKQKNVNAMIAVTQNIRHDYSKVDCGTNVDGAAGIVQKIIEKPQLDFPSWTGIGIFKAGYFAGVYYNLPQYYNSEDVDFAYDILPAMVKEGQLWAYQYDGRWFDVGNLRSYQKLAKEYQNKDLNL